MNKHLTLTAVALTLGTLLTAGTTASHAEGADVTIYPAQLKRGADVRGPHVENRTVVDGATRISVKGEYVELLGKSGDAYVVVVGVQDGRQWTTKRVKEGRAARTLVKGPGPGEIALSDDGSRLAVRRGASPKSSVISSRSAFTGRVRARHRYSGYVDVLDVSRTRVLLGGYGFDTAIWRPDSNHTDLVTTADGYAGDLSSNRLATYTKDPYTGGCTVVSTLAAGRRLWRSCDERVEAFSPNGNKIATVSILSDGIGPSEVITRGLKGKRIAGYSVARYFGELRWESNRALLLDSYGKDKAAVVRCDAGTCRRASRLRNTPPI